MTVIDEEISIEELERLYQRCEDDPDPTVPPTPPPTDPPPANPDPKPVPPIDSEPE